MTNTQNRLNNLTLIAQAHLESAIAALKCARAIHVKRSHDETLDKDRRLASAQTSENLRLLIKDLESRVKDV